MIAEPICPVAVRAPILVIDDDRHLLDVVGLVLRFRGYDVVTAANGREALDRICDLGETGRPAMILLDMRMPIMDGWAFIEEIRARYATLPRVIVFSAAEDAQSLAERIRADGFLEKPFELKELLSTIEKNYLA